MNAIKTIAACMLLLLSWNGHARDKAGISEPDSSGVSDVVPEYEIITPAVVHSVKGNRKILLGRGARLPGVSVSMVNESGCREGAEIGGMAHVRRPFRIEDAEISVSVKNSEKAVLGLMVYRCGNGNEYTPVRHMPVYRTVMESDGAAEVRFDVEEDLLLDPGRYYIALRVVEIEKGGSLEFPAYVKGMTCRTNDLEDITRLPLGAGLKISGTEFRM